MPEPIYCPNPDTDEDDVTEVEAGLMDWYENMLVDQAQEEEMLNQARERGEI